MVMMEHSAKLGTSGESRVMMVWFMVFNATFNNISIPSWWPVLLVEVLVVPGENHRPVVVKVLGVPGENHRPVVVKVLGVPGENHRSVASH